MRSRTSWQIKQWWARQHARVVTCALWCLFCAALDMSGAFDGVHATTHSVFTTIERAYASPPESVLVVTTTARTLDAATLAALRGPSSEVVLVDASLLPEEDAPLDALPCDERLLYYGSFERPRALPERCLFVSSSPRDVDLTTRYVPSRSHDVALWEAIKGVTKRDLTAHEGFLWFGALPPIVSSKALLDGARRRGAMTKGRVLLITAPPDSLHLLPGGEQISRERLRAQILANLFEARLIETPPLPVLWLVGALLLCFAASADRTRLVRLFAASGALVLLSGALALTLSFWMQVLVPLLIAWGGVVILALLPPRISDLQVDVRMRLLDVVRDVNAERAHLITREQHFFDQSLLRAMDLLGSPPARGMIAELPEGSWWIVPRAFHDLAEEELFERRRDIRREPYETPRLMKRAAVSSRQFLQDASHDAILAPLIHGDRLMGFWLIAPSRGEQARALLEERGARIQQVSRQLAKEIAWRRIEIRQGRKSAVFGVDQLVDEALLTLEQLTLQKETLKHVVHGTRIGLLLVSLLGEVVFVNDHVYVQLGSRVDAAMSAPGLEVILSALLDLDQERDAPRATLDEALLGRIQRWQIDLEDEESTARRRTLEVVLSPVRDQTGEGDVSALLFTVHDISELVDADAERSSVLRAFHTTTTNVARTIEQYADVLAQSTSLSKAERRITAQLTRASSTLAAQIDAMQSVLDEEPAADKHLPVSLGHAMRRFLRQQDDAAASAFALRDVFKAPLIVRADPERLQRALALVWQEVGAWRAVGATVHVACDASARAHVAMTWTLEGSALPSSVLRGIAGATQRTWREVNGHSESALQRAGALLATMDALLEVRFDDALALRFTFTSAHTDIAEVAA